MSRVYHQHADSAPYHPSSLEASQKQRESGIASVDGAAQKQRLNQTELASFVGGSDPMKTRGFHGEKHNLITSFCKDMVPLQMQTCRIILWKIFSCRCRHAGSYSGRSSLADADMLDDTLKDLLLQMQTCGMIRWEIFTCRCRHAG